MRSQCRGSGAIPGISSLSHSYINSWESYCQHLIGPVFVIAVMCIYILCCLISFIYIYIWFIRLVHGFNGKDDPPEMNPDHPHRFWQSHRGIQPAGPHGIPEFLVLNKSPVKRQNFIHMLFVPASVNQLSGFFQMHPHMYIIYYIVYCMWQNHGKPNSKEP